MPSAPLGTSSQSRKRAKEIQFAGRNAEQGDNKENIASDAETTARASQTTNLERPKKPPRTPASKIPLADLIGNTEDIFNGAAFDATPEDHVFWQHGPRSSDPSSSLRSTQRGKKRARSSSPASSSQLEKSNHCSAQKEALDLQTLQQSLKTPQHDPASDLWARYATASLAKNGEGPVLPPFAHLITSSPQTPSTTNSKDSGLRRSTSCGIEWPTSENKRRKITKREPFGPAKNIFESLKPEIPEHDKGEATRVQLLVEKLSESIMRKQYLKPTVPSSSSPLPDRTEVTHGPPASPLPARVTAQAQKEQPMQDSESEQIVEEASRSQHGLATIIEDGNSSEFGDADLDLDFLKTVELATSENIRLKFKVVEATVGAASAIPDPHVVPGKIRAPHEEQSSVLSRSKDSGHCLTEPASVTNAMTEQLSDDDFGTGDDEDFATEMQGLVEKYDTQDTTISTGDAEARHSQIQHLDSGIDSNMQIWPTENDIENAFDDDDDLWTEMGKSLSPHRTAGVGSTSQVRAFR